MKAEVYLFVLWVCLTQLNDLRLKVFLSRDDELKTRWARLRRIIGDAEKLVSDDAFLRRTDNERKREKGSYPAISVLLLEEIQSINKSVTNI